ncbi:hypothetical protein EDD85DRAFT_559107 [Armillaria nabsnona]|nr:hypothetical protein EDD85DRAFT_559107 [Armillaria nabsnona]
MFKKRIKSKWNEGLMHQQQSHDVFLANSEAWRPEERGQVQDSYLISVERRDHAEAMMQEPFKLDHLLRPSRRRHVVEQFLKNAEYTHSLVTISSADARRRGLLPRKIYSLQSRHNEFHFPAVVNDSTNAVKLRIDVEEIKRSERRCGILLRSGDSNPIEVIHAVASVTDWNDLKPHSSANVLIAQIRSLLRDSTSSWDKMGLVPSSAAKRVIDTLQWEADYASEVGNYRKICISCLQELAGIHAIVPTSCYLSSEVVTKVGDHPVGGSANCEGLN